MAKFLLIESRDSLESNDARTYCELATGLVKDGNEVTLFLVQNGVLPARKSPASRALVATAEAGVTVLADEFSLKERGITSDRLAPGVKSAPLDHVIDLLSAGAKAMWH
jgi:predicted peroxiredoxin